MRLRPAAPRGSRTAFGSGTDLHVCVLHTIAGSTKEPGNDHTIPAGREGQRAIMFKQAVLSRVLQHAVTAAGTSPGAGDIVVLADTNLPDRRRVEESNGLFQKDIFLRDLQTKYHIPRDIRQT